MANQPPNPYAPTEALNHEAAAPDKEKEAALARPSRFGAVVVAIFAQPIAGAGFYLLRERRLFLAWTAVTLAVRALLVVAVWAPVPRLLTIAILATALTALGSVVHTATTKPRSTPLKRGALIGVLFVVAGYATSLAVKQWLVEAFQIPAGSMIPSLLVGDHILIKKGSGGVQRGDVVVFRFPRDPSIDYVKRVVAVGGDTIEVRGGVPWINGVALAHEPINEPCSFSETSPRGEGESVACALARETDDSHAYTIMFEANRPTLDFPPTKVAPGELFMLGDNRDNSYDSRQWGTVKVDLVKGKPTVIWWSRGIGKLDIRWSRVGHGVE